MNQIPVIQFQQDEYGDELLINIMTLDKIRSHRTYQKVLRHSFYGVMLTMEGEGDIEVDGVSSTATKGTVSVTRPGDVCTIKKDGGLFSLYLVFERDFLLSFFNNLHFLDSLPFFSHRRNSPFIRLNELMYNRILKIFLDIQFEITHDRNQHLLRAQLHETLILLQKQYPIEAPGKMSTDTRIARF